MALTFAEVQEDLERFKRDIIQEAEAFPGLIAALWQDEVYRRARLTGRFHESIDFRETIFREDFREFQVDTLSDPLVTYSGFLEGGTIYMQPRFLAKTAIENFDPSPILDDIQFQPRV